MFHMQRTVFQHTLKRRDDMDRIQLFVSVPVATGSEVKEEWKLFLRY